MAWRLARLPYSYLARFDNLLGVAASIDGWKAEVRSLVGDADFSVFWSLIWQLQVAEYLVQQGYALKWLSDGPDLLASKDGQRRYVECFTPRKHFGRSLFLEELLRALHPNLRVDSLMFLKRTMPDGHALDAFLDSLFQQLLEPGFVEDLESQARIKYPVPVPLPEGADNLNVYMDGQNAAVYDPHVLPKGAGDVDAYWSLILNEVVSSKSNANSLAISRPNAVLVNFLLGYDQQAATWMGDPPATDLGPNLDELVWGTIGISSAISTGELSSVHGWLP